MPDTDTNIANASTLALRALGWALADEKRAERLLALTGMTPDILRSAVNERSTQAAILGFLEAHEPDLIACAVAIDVNPEILVAARQELDGGALEL
ncbi:MAG: DUF3572 domain-containing protein [Sphingorhabdus sp.]